MFLIRSPHEHVHGFNLWKWPHDQRFGNCCNNNDSNVSSPAAASEMMKSRHEVTSSFGATALTDLCLANPSSFDSNFQQAFDDGVTSLIMSSSSKMKQMRTHGELFKLTSHHGNNNYNNNNNNTNSNNNTSIKRNPKTQSQEKFTTFNIK
jgi:hypothetical protein